MTTPTEPTEVDRDEDDSSEYECPMGTCDGSGWYWDESDPINDGPGGTLCWCPYCNPGGKR